MFIWITTKSIFMKMTENLEKCCEKFDLMLIWSNRLQFSQWKKGRTNLEQFVRFCFYYFFVLRQEKTSTFFVIIFGRCGNMIKSCPGTSISISRNSDYSVANSLIQSCTQTFTQFRILNISEFKHTPHTTNIHTSTHNLYLHIIIS